MITLDPSIVIAVAGAIVFGILGITTQLVITRFRRKRLNKKFLAAQESAKESKRKREAIVNMFPDPWIKAYDACRQTKTYSAGKEWLKKWLEEQEPFVLPDITVEAAEKLGELIANRKGSGHHNALLWDEAMAMLAPYFDTGNKSKNPQQQVNSLPGKWNDLVNELKGFAASRRDEFLEAMVQESYPPLLPQQIPPLARLLAAGDTWHDPTGDFYAAHLEIYVCTP